MNFRNRKLAWKHFYPEGNGKAKPGYCLHHKDETLRHENPDRYNEWNPEDLVMMIGSDHMRLHHIGNTCAMGHVVSEETKRKLSESQKGKYISEETRRKVSESRKGHVVSEETRRKLSESHKGRPSSFKGCHHSEEAKRKMREAKRRNK